MIQTLIDQIVAALRGVFPQVRVYTEQVKQGFTEPCFIVNCVNLRNQLFIGKRYKRDNLFSVKYFPESTTDGNEECYAVRDTLFEILEIIGEEGHFTRGTGMNGEVVDGVLVFTVNYNVFAVREVETTPLHALDLKQTVKG